MGLEPYQEGKHRRSETGGVYEINDHLFEMDIEPKSLIMAVRARPFNTTFNWQVGAVRSLYGSQLRMPKLSGDEIRAELEPLLEYDAQRKWEVIAERMSEMKVARQRF